MKTTFKRFVPDILAVLFFAVVSLVYFMGPIRDGKVLSGHDHSAGDGMSVELNHYRETHDGERSRWTNSIFGGMPSYQISPSYPSTNLLGKFESVYQLGLPAVAGYVFMMLLGFYILLRAFDFRVWMSALGAVLWAFSSYYFIIIAAGHIWKLLTLSFIPPTIAGMVLCYRKRYLPGILVTALFTAMQILSNHVQMTYYFLFVVGFMVVAYFVDAYRSRTLRQWWMGTVCFAVGGILGLCVNASNLYHTWQYSKESMRGKSELTQVTKDPTDQTDSGLERSYITMWSYGIGETWTLLVPNTKGGASVPLSQNETAMKKAKSEYGPIYGAFTQYFGEQPGTSGPVYVGAFVLMLFVLGLFTVKGPVKWALLAATVLSILLSWGKNFMPMTDLFLDYVPMYDKFRTVASILVMAEFTIPLLAMLALRKLVDEGVELRPLALSFALTGGVAFLFWLMPDLFFGQYVSTSDLQYMDQFVQAGYIPKEMSGSILANMSEMRRAMFTADALRSFFVITVGTLVLLAYHYRKIGSVPMVGCLIVLCLADMWGVNKRYLNDSMFSAPKPKAQSYPKSQADEIILQDTSAYYRVLNLSVNTFNDNTTSVYHKSIGGYHPAKLRRYQELIEACIRPEMSAIGQAASAHGGLLEEVNGDSLFPVLNMLNTKYLILPAKEGARIPVMNVHAYGNAWYVRNLSYVGSADEELASLRQISPRNTAVAHKDFRTVLGEQTTFEVDSTSSVELQSYEANRLSYRVNSAHDGMVVFSDVYYPGWKCTVDGQEVPIGRVDYVLRAVRMPKGSHEVVMTFYPTSIKVTEGVAYSALAILLLALLAYVGYTVYVCRKTK